MEQSRANLVEVPPFFFIVKVVQIAISVLVLALAAASIALEGGYGFYGGQGYAIFVCIATWITCGWYIASSRFMPNLYHRIPALILEIFLWIWWLSCWTTLAYWASWAALFNADLNIYGYYSVNAGALTGVLGVAAALAAINWVLVFTTAVVFIIHLMRFQRNHAPAAVATTQPAPKYEMQPQQQPQYQQQVPQQQAYPAQQPYVQQPYGQQQYAQQQAQFDQSAEHKIAV
jgi:hypothetical protein